MPPQHAYISLNDFLLLGPTHGLHKR